MKLVEDTDVVDASIKDGYLTLELDGDGSFGVNTMISNQAMKGLEAMKIAFEDENVVSATAKVTGTLTDTKGNGSKDDIVTINYTRESFDELNYDNFHRLSLGEEWRIYNESDTYLIHIGVYNNLKDKIKDNLAYGPYKAN